MNLLMFISSIFIAILVYMIIYYNAYRYIKINLYPKLNFSSRYEKLKRVNKKGKVIISMTSIPYRMETSKYAISSLLDQTRRVDEIRFYIPYKSIKGVEYVIPDWMEKLSKTVKQFKIKRCDRDWGPATKIIPAIIGSEKEDIDTIIYLDDDIIYNRDVIELLVSYSNIYPKSAICNQGWNIDKWSTGYYIVEKMYQILKFMPRSDPYYKTPIDVLQGFSAVLVKPNFFDIPSLIDVEKYPSEVFYVDDVYLSGILNNNKINRVSTHNQAGMPYWSEFLNGFILRKAPYSLSSTYNKYDLNDRKAVNCFKWYKQVRIDVK